MMKILNLGSTSLRVAVVWTYVQSDTHDLEGIPMKHCSYRFYVFFFYFQFPAHRNFRRDDWLKVCLYRQTISRIVSCQNGEKSKIASHVKFLSEKCHPALLIRKLTGRSGMSDKTSDHLTVVTQRPSLVCL